MGKLNVVLDWFANTNHTGFLLAEKRGYFAEAGLEVHIDGEVHGVMDRSTARPPPPCASDTSGRGRSWPWH